MEKIIKRKDITEDIYKLIFRKEKHHSHVIIEDAQGTLRWKGNPVIKKFLKNISLNDLCPLLIHLGYDKNSEVYRKLYRDMGYSLFGYWEIFYWDWNNYEADEYNAPSDIPHKKLLMELVKNKIAINKDQAMYMRLKGVYQTTMPDKENPKLNSILRFLTKG